MAIVWTGLRIPPPASLRPAREAAHYALDRVARAARANVAPQPDDSHTALTWDTSREARMCAAGAGLHLAALRLLVVRGGLEERLALEGQRAKDADAWLDARLAAAGLRPASAIKLPYETPARPFHAEPAQALALARWFGAASELFREVRRRYAAYRPGPGAAVVWPHHFDMAVLVRFEEGAGEAAKSIGIGLSPGDHYYEQPYLYVSAYPPPKKAKAPKLPPGGHWHTKDFVGAVATADEVLAQKDPRAAALAVIDAAFAAGKGWLHV
jgi:hypothetical protein